MADEKPKEVEADLVDEENLEEEEKKSPGRKPVKVSSVEIYRDSKGEWRWKAKSANNKTIADSAEGYRNRPWARKMAVELYPDAKIVWGPK